MTPSQIADPLIGRLVDDRYRVRARIARGGMATVYVATDLRLERRIALKVMHQHLSDDSVFQSRFIQEARAAARLADPHVVNVFDQGQDGELAYLVMEYLPGITLRELLKEQRRLSVSQTVTIMDAILSGLAAAHRAGIVHRDVKPENVLLAEDGRIKIGDFGLARATTANTATGQQLMGTIAYLAPELVTRGTADARSDIYALGIMMYEMLTGEQPYRGEQPMQIAFQHATESVPRPSVRNPGVPEPIDELVLWATEREPDDRPLDAQVMLDRLRDIEHELGISPVVTRRETPTMTAGLAIPEDANTGGITTVMPLELESTGPTAPVDSTDNATRLRQVGRRNRRKGAWLLLLVLLLAALAGGAAWWFGSGPGSLVAVPQVAGKTWDEASAALTAVEFKPEQATESSRDVGAGLVIRTDPAAGKRLDKDARVSVVVSSGPAATSVGSFEGMSRADAEAALQKHYISLSGDVAEEFNADVPADTVMTVTVTPAAGGDAVACTAGCDVHEGDAATMLVSLGPVADVVGKSVADATKTLTDQGLKVDATPKEEYSDTAPAGQVIRMEGAEGDTGAWKKGDTAVLVVSLGLPPVEVPDIRGMVVTDAVAELENLGFKVKVNFPQILWPATKVTAFTPDAGTTQTKGSEITITDVAVNIG